MDRLFAFLSGIFYDSNPLIACLVLLVLFIVAGELSFRIRVSKTSEEAAAAGVALVLGGILTLLALMLGFSFAMSQDRYETRRQLVIDEANSIGTTYLRTWPLQEPMGSHIRDLLRKYVALRVEIVRTPELTPEKVRQFDKGAKELHNEIWTLAAAVARDHATPITAVFLQALNEMIDLHAKRLAAFRNRVPFSIYSVLFLLAFIAMSVLGFYLRVRGIPARSLTVMVALLVVSVLWLIMDLDQPSRGIIKASQQSLIELHEDLSRDTKG